MPVSDEQLLDVEQPHDLAVDAVLALAAAEDRAADLDLGHRHGDLARRVVDDELHLGHAEGRSGGGSGEDDVGHVTAAEGASALLAERPADRVHQVRLARPVRTDDHADARDELQDGLVRERLEAADLDRRRNIRRDANSGLRAEPGRRAEFPSERPGTPSRRRASPRGRPRSPRGRGAARGRTTRAWSRRVGRDPRTRPRPAVGGVANPPGHTELARLLAHAARKNTPWTRPVTKTWTRRIATVCRNRTVRYARGGLRRADRAAGGRHPERLHRSFGHAPVDGGETIVPRVNPRSPTRCRGGARGLHAGLAPAESRPTSSRTAGSGRSTACKETWGAEFIPSSASTVRSSARAWTGSDGYSGFSVRDPESGETSPTTLEAMLRETEASNVW